MNLQCFGDVNCASLVAKRITKPDAVLAASQRRRSSWRSLIAASGVLAGAGCSWRSRVMRWRHCGVANSNARVGVECVQFATGMCLPLAFDCRDFAFSSFHGKSAKCSFATSLNDNARETIASMQLAIELYTLDRELEQYR